MTFLVLAGLFAITPCVIAGCSGGERQDAAPAASSAAPLPVPSPPADLAARVSFAAPREVMPALRAELGDAVATWPGSFGSLVTGSTGLPITIAELVSDAVPIAVTILSSEGGIEAVAAIHVRSADRLATIATAGADALFRAVPGEAGLVRLVPVRLAASGLRLAVLGNHLLVATSDGALERAGPFTERAPPTTLGSGELVAMMHGPATPDLVRRAVARAVAASPGPTLAPLGLSSSGKLPGSIDALLGALEGGRTTVTIDDHVLRVTVTAGDSLIGRFSTAAAATSSATGWLSLPRDASVALLFHAGGAGSDPIAPSDDLASSLGVKGARREAVAAAMTSLDRARAPSVVVAAGLAPGGPALWFRAPLADERAADAALVALVKAFGDKSQKERPSATARATVVERVGDVVRVRVRAAGPDDRPAVDVILRREGDLLLGVTGLDAIGAIQALLDGTNTSRLASDPFAEKLASSSAQHNALALVDLEGLTSLSLGKPRSAKRVLMGASLAESGGVMRLLLLAEPAALPFLREKLSVP